MMEIIDAINSLSFLQAVLFGISIGIIIKCIYHYGYLQGVMKG